MMIGNNKAYGRALFYVVELTERNCGHQHPFFQDCTFFRICEKNVSRDNFEL